MERLFRALGTAALLLGFACIMLDEAMKVVGVPPFREYLGISDAEASLLLGMIFTLLALDNYFSDRL